MSECMKSLEKVVEYFKLMENVKGIHPPIDSDEAVKLFFLKGYGEKYANIYYKGINYAELRNKMFYGYA